MSSQKTRQIAAVCVLGAFLCPAGYGADMLPVGKMTASPYQERPVQTSDTLRLPGSAYNGALTWPFWTAARTQAFQDASGTIALLQDIPAAANPTAEVDGTVVNGVADTFMRSDAAPALADPFTPADDVQDFNGGITALTPSGTFASALTLTGATGASIVPPAMEIDMPSDGQVIRVRDSASAIRYSLRSDGTPGHLTQELTGDSVFVMADEAAKMQLGTNLSELTWAGTTGTQTWLLPDGSGTVAVSATSPIVIDPVTGDVSCPTCGTGSGSVTSVTVNATAGTPYSSSTTPNFTIAGAGISSTAIAGSTLTVTSTEADTLATVTGRGAATATTSTFGGAAYGDANSISLATSAIEFEGATANAFETLLKVTDPTALRSITFPDNSGTVALTSDITGTVSSVTVNATSGTPYTSTTTPSFTIAGAGISSTAISGSTVTVTSTEADTLATVTTRGSNTSNAFSSNSTITGGGAFGAASSTSIESGGLLFEGSSADANETLLTPVNPTAARTIYLPNASGTVPIPATEGTTGQVLTSAGTGAAPTWGTAGTGTVTSVSVTTANGVSGTVATATTTPAISLTLGAITPSSVASTGAVSGTTGTFSSTLSTTRTAWQDWNVSTAMFVNNWGTVSITGLTSTANSQVCYVPVPYLPGTIIDKLRVYAGGNGTAGNGVKIKLTKRAANSSAAFTLVGAEQTYTGASNAQNTYTLGTPETMAADTAYVIVLTAVASSGSASLYNVGVETTTRVY